MTEPPAPCKEKEESCRLSRYEKQMAENREVLTESVSMLKSVAERLERAARSLEDHTVNAPFEDLER